MVTIKNDYRIIGGTVEIDCMGMGKVHTTIIDLGDFHIADAITGHWRLVNNYVIGSRGGINVRLHREIVGRIPKDMVVDHIDRNP